MHGGLGMMDGTGGVGERSLCPRGTGARNTVPPGHGMGNMAGVRSLGEQQRTGGRAGRPGVGCPGAVAGCPGARAAARATWRHRGRPPEQWRTPLGAGSTDLDVCQPPARLLCHF